MQFPICFVVLKEDFKWLIHEVANARAAVAKSLFAPLHYWLTKDYELLKIQIVALRLSFFLRYLTNTLLRTQGDTVAKANYISNYLLMPSAFSGFFKVTQCVIKLPKKVYCNLILDCKDKMNPPK